MAVDLQSTVASLRRQAEALAGLRERCAALREARTRSHAELAATTAEIDARIDECLLIGEYAALGDPRGDWKDAVTQLEHHLRTLGVLRSKVLALYAVGADVRCES